MKNKPKDIYFKKKKSVPKPALIAVAAVAALAIVLCGYFGMQYITNAREEKAEIGFGSFSTKGFDKIADIKSFGEEIAVFTPKKSEKKGLMTLDGKVTQEADFFEFSVCSDAWRSVKYIAEKENSETKYLVDTINGRVTAFEYNGPEKPEKTACWNTAARSLVWTDSKGYAGEVKLSEIVVNQGIYPVSSSMGENAKWGFVDKNLDLKITLTYDAACEFGNGYAAVKSGGKWGYINEAEILKIPFAYDSCADETVGGADCAFGFRNGLAPVKKDGKYGIINKSGKTVINFVFDKIIQGKDGKYLALKDGRWGLITVDEEKVSATEPTAAERPTQAATLYNLGEYKVRTSGSPLNMRREADKTSPVVKKIPNGTVVKVEKSTAGWSLVEYDGAEGWVSTKYLEKIK